MRRNFTISAILALFLLSIMHVSAQNVEFTKANFASDSKGLSQAIKNLKTGDMYFFEGKQWLYLKALEYYKKANDFNPNNAVLNFKIGKCILSTINKTEAIKYLEKAKELDASKAPYETEFLLAEAYHLNYEFDKAIELFKKFENSTDPSVSAAMAKKKIQECETAKVLIADTVRINEAGDTVKVIIKNIGTVINGTYPEYNPIVNADESMMIFTSQREGSTGGQISTEDYTYYEDIYISHRNDVMEWGAPENPGSPLNSMFNDAIVGLSPDGQKLFTYKGDNGGDIYMSVLKGSEWSKPEKLPETINTTAKESSASFSFDGRTIYFVSNKPGGSGGDDIYMSKMDGEGNWGTAQNLGPVINTQYDESGVFMHPDGKTLYFSSVGHNTMGSLDIFKSVYEDGKWSEPENVGYPVNTPDRDAFFSIAANGQHGFFSSVRTDGYGSSDIYEVTFKARPPQLALLKGTILDEKTLKPVEAQIEITDNETNEVIATFTSNSATGKYLITLPSGHNYGISVKADNYLFHSENLDLPKSYSYTEINKDIKLKSIAVGSKIVLNNIFYDFGKSTLRPESKAELDKLVKLMNDIPKLRIEIGGHTDNKSSYAFNMKLSEARAKSVVDYLIQNGIDRDRLRYKGYGYSMPIASNDTEEGRQLNRRTEFEVLGK